MTAPEIVLLDIEGTTSPLSFVTEVLFPFARQQLRPYLSQHWEDPRVQQLRSELPPHQPDLDSVVQLLEGWMDQDLKLGPLKTLQGWIWEEGYQAGQLQGQFFPDVPLHLRTWHEQGQRVAIYSSGSVLAQQLLFKNSSSGDLSSLVERHFDTAIGAKTAPHSYRTIARQLGVEAERSWFLTDVVAEALAAREGGWQVAISLRPGNQPQPQHDFPTLENFHHLPWRQN